MKIRILSWFEEHNKISWIITLFGAGLIFYISTLSFGGDERGGIGFLSILYHFFAFFCFSFFLFISLIRGKRKRFFILGILISVLYAISDEIHQFFVPDRFCSLFDVLIDSAGIFFSFLLYYILVLIRE